MGYGRRENNKGKTAEVNCRNSLELSSGWNCKGGMESLMVGMNVVEYRDVN